VVEDPVLKFMVVAITGYGMATFEGPMLSVKSVNALAHYTDWIVAHVHTGALSWNGFLTFGMIYWLAPRLFQAPLFSKKLAEAHFWVATFGIILYVVAIYSAGVTQGLMWRAFDETGRLTYPDFVETVARLVPMYWVRVAGGTLYITGAILFAYNIFRTWRARPAAYAVPVVQAPPLSRVEPAAVPAPVPAGAWARFVSLGWHRRWEGLPITFTVLTALAVVIASLFEIIPTFLIKSNVPTIASVQPYTPLELAGRDLYIREGCFNCHSQMVRPFRYETERYGDYSKPGESVFEHPFLWGSRRIGPDLAREGGKYPDLWHVRHFQNPRAISPKSIMPAYSHFMTNALDFERIQSRVDAMAMLGVPYGDAVNNAAALARTQAQAVAGSIAQAGGETGLESREIVAIIAYMQRLGRDAQALASGTNARPRQRDSTATTGRTP
jgi:cytochrome c oxidase cbb3-type subunit I/II